jgi:hypothetical protein
MSTKKNVGRPKGSRNRPKIQGFYKLAPQQVLEYFGDAPFIPVSKDWLLKRVGDTKLFDAFFQTKELESPSPSWKVQEL